MLADGREANRPDHIIIRFCSRSYSVWTDFLFSFLFLGLIPSCLFAFAWSYQLFSSVHDRPGCRNLAHVRRLCACPAFQPPAWKWRRGLAYLSCSTYYGVVVVIAKAGAEAALLLGHEDQTSVFAASDDTDGTNIDTIQMADRTTILLRRGTTRTNTWYT